MSIVVVVFFALTSVPIAFGHGHLGKPQARNFPAGDRNAYCPHCGNGQANVCGDGGQWPSKSNYLDFYNGPQATYVAGRSVEFEITVTAHHKGHFEFSICDEIISSSTTAPQECLNRMVLQRVAPEQSYSDCTPNDERGDCQPLDERHPERWYLPPPSSKNVHAMRFQLPMDLMCESCTLQWRYWTANSCVPKVDYKCYFDAIRSKGWNSQAWCGGLCGGCGETSVQCNGEEFRNCADIEVTLSDGADATTTLRTGSPSTTSPLIVAPSSTTTGGFLAPSTASPSTIAPAPTTSGGLVEECVPHSVLKCINGRSSYWPKCDPSQAKTNIGPHGYEFGFYCTEAWSDSLNAMLSDPVVGKCRNQQAIHNLLAQVAYETGYFSTVYQPRDGGAGLIHMIPNNWAVNARDMESLWPGQGYEAQALASGKAFFQNASFGWRSVAAWYKKTNRVVPGCNLDLFDHDFATQTRCILSWVNDRASAYNIVADCLAVGPSTIAPKTSAHPSTAGPSTTAGPTTATPTTAAPTSPPPTTAAATSPPLTTSSAPVVCRAVSGNSAGATDQRCRVVCPLLSLGEWPCGAGYPCSCESKQITSTSLSTSSAGTHSSTTPGSTSGPMFTTSKRSAAGCIATPNLNRGVKDEDCNRCDTGYRWWPCNEAALCTCDVASSSASAASFSKPVVHCVASPNLNKGVTDEHCKRCETGSQLWPCNEAALCRCVAV